MAPIAIVFGVLLTILGGGMFVYVGMSPDKITALIPAFFGIPLIGLGFLARKDKFRMHAMHVAALLGLAGFAMPAYMVTMVFVRGRPFEQEKHGEQAAMSVLCLVFLILCVKSFIDARIARKKKEAEAQPSPPLA